MILTYKIRHGRDFSEELAKARQVAAFAITHRDCLSSKFVKHLGLKSAIANQILRKYGRDRRCQQVRRVNLIVPGQSIHVDQSARLIRIPCLALCLSYQFRNDFQRIHQIELNAEFACVSVSVGEPPCIPSPQAIGVDLNATGHVAVCAVPSTGKVYKLGKRAPHVHRQYKSMRRTLQKRGQYRQLKQLKRRESRIVRDINHKISQALVTIAFQTGSSIKLEHLAGIRQRAPSTKRFRYALNSWSFFQLARFIEYKATLRGVEVLFVDPAYSSQDCSRCGTRGTRNGKTFQCPACGHADHADANASFNLAQRLSSMGRSDRLHRDSDRCKGNPDLPGGATVRSSPTPEPHDLQSWE